MTLFEWKLKRPLFFLGTLLTSGFTLRTTLPCCMSFTRTCSSGTNGRRYPNARTGLPTLTFPSLWIPLTTTLRGPGALRPFWGMGVLVPAAPVAQVAPVAGVVAGSGAGATVEGVVTSWADATAG